MIDFKDEELKKWSKLFREQFDDGIPLREIPRRVTNEELVDAIKKSLEAKKNLLPEIFGYGGHFDREY